jgi:opacity protein-like surface antigen
VASRILENEPAVQARPVRSLLTLSRAAAFFALSALAATAYGAGEKDKAALKLHDSAMNEDYLAVEFPKAEKKLKDAIKLCGASGCSPAVLGKLHVALATVNGVGQSKYDVAKEEFVAALKADPNAAPDKGLSTPELMTAYNEAKGGAGATEAPVEKPTKRAPGGDLPHTAPTESGVNSPLPVYIDVPTDLGAAKVTLRYKPFGGTAWKTIEMHKMGEGYGAEIPCDDMNTTGDVKYYITVSDDTNSPIAQAGTLKEPYRVPIKNELEGEAPHLPGRPPPKQCAAKGDCPPGLPGCPAVAGTRGDKTEGAICETTTECQSGLACLNGTCVEDKSAPEEPGAKKGKHNVIGAFLQLDMTLLKSKTPSSSSPGVCAQSNSSSYGCFEKGTSHQFFGEPDDTVKNTDGVSGGFAFAGARALIGYDRQLLATQGLYLGARFGIAFGGSMPTPDNTPESELQTAGLGWQPAKSFPPIHAEARIGYALGGTIFEGGHFHPYVYAGFGVGRVTASVNVNVCDKLDSSGKTVTASAGKDCNNHKDRATTVDAYQIEGLNFAPFGIGTTYGITENFGIAAELKVMVMFPTVGVVFSPTIGPVVAF